MSLERNSTFSRWISEVGSQRRVFNITHPFAYVGIEPQRTLVVITSQRQRVMSYV